MADGTPKADRCRACDGNGRINDTTYNRAGGDDVECGKCCGSGLGQQSIARLVKDRSRAAPSAGLREALELLQGFLSCPEIADCAPEDKDPETDDLERRARALTLSKEGEEVASHHQTIARDE